MFSTIGRWGSIHWCLPTGWRYSWRLHRPQRDVCCGIPWVWRPSLRNRLHRVPYSYRGWCCTGCRRRGRHRNDPLEPSNRCPSRRRLAVGGTKKGKRKEELTNGSSIDKPFLKFPPEFTYPTNTVDAHIARAGITRRAVDDAVRKHDRKELTFGFAVQLTWSTWRRHNIVVIFLNRTVCWMNFHFTFYLNRQPSVVVSFVGRLVESRALDGPIARPISWARLFRQKQMPELLNYSIRGHANITDIQIADAVAPSFAHAIFSAVGWCRIVAETGRRSQSSSARPSAIGPRSPFAPFAVDELRPIAHLDALAIVAPLAGEKGIMKLCFPFEKKQTVKLNPLESSEAISGKRRNKIIWAEALAMHSRLLFYFSLFFYISVSFFFNCWVVTRVKQDPALIRLVSYISKSVAGKKSPIGRLQGE